VDIVSNKSPDSSADHSTIERSWRMDTEKVSPPDPPFSREEYQARLRRMRKRMGQEKIDMLYLTSPAAMYYFHGYRARWYREESSTEWPALAGTAIHVDHDRLIHFDYPREKRLLEGTSVAEDVRFLPYKGIPASGIEMIMTELAAEGWLGGVIGMEFYSPVPNRAISQMVEAGFIQKGCKSVVDATIPVRSLRRLKSPQEIAYIEEAARICDIAHKTVQEVLRPGMTELEVYGETVRAMTRAGGETAAIEGNVSSGSYATEHALSSRRVIQKGEIVFFDPCGVYNRYHANIARGYFVGDPPNDLIERYRLSAGSYELLKEHAKPGESVAKVCRLLKQYYQDEGIWDLRAFVGGYQLGIAFPPDWVGEFYFNVDLETEGVFMESEVTNYESILGTILIDTFVYESTGPRQLSEIPAELIVVDG
jgi:Xaa-Pro aminopeptidase